LFLGGVTVQESKEFLVEVIDAGVAGVGPLDCRLRQLDRDGGIDCQLAAVG
jgi:hypothetical protein